MRTKILGRTMTATMVMIACADLRMGHPSGTDRPSADLLDDIECWPSPIEDGQFRGDHPNDQGERTNKKLRVQPFYHRARNGKMRKY